MSCSELDGLVGGAGQSDRHRLRLKHGGKVKYSVEEALTQF